MPAGTPWSRSLVGCVLILGCAGDGEEPAGSEGSDGSSSGVSLTSTADGGPGDGPAANTDSGESGGDPTTGGGDDSTGELPEATLPVFVAMGDGGWLATSCDAGQSWTHTAFSTEIGDHTPWTSFGGLASGADGFVAGFGWGAPGYLLRSGDGLTWDELPPESFLVDGMPTPYDSWTAGVAHTGTGFIAFAATIWGSPDGQTWMPAGVSLPPGSDQLRQLRGFPDEGLLVAALESQSGEGHPVGNFIAVSGDGGASWTEGPGFDPACGDAIQHWGDIEARGDTILVATGTMCRSTDRGQTWSSLGQPIGGQIQDLFSDGEAFWAITGSRLFRSDDGTAWTEMADVGVELRAAVWGSGTYVAVGPRGTDFFHSDDGLTWQPSALDWTPDGETWVRDLAAGALAGGC